MWNIQVYKTRIDRKEKKKITLWFESSHCLWGFILLWIGSEQETDIKTKRCDETNIEQQDHNQVPLAGLDVANIDAEHTRLGGPGRKKLFNFR